MSLGFAVHCLSGAGLVAAFVSLATAALLPLVRTRLRRLAPAAQARLYLLLIIAPAFLALALHGGWLIQFHLISATAATHEHQYPVPMTPLLLAAGALLAVRLSVSGTRGVVDSWRSLRTVRDLRRVSTLTAAGYHLCPEERPQAFVAGLLRPRIFVSSGLLAAIDGRGLSTILAHEQAHVRRRDPLRRLLASLALAFHLPGVAAALESDLARAHECAADSDAAGRVGDATGVAETLLRVARLQLAAAPAAAHSAAIAGGDLAARVEVLLLTQGGADAPGIVPIAAGLAGLFAAAVIFAAPLHEAAQAVVVLLGG